MIRSFGYGLHRSVFCQNYEQRLVSRAGQVSAFQSATTSSGRRIWPREVTLVEVGPRDGLQNETSTVPTAVKVILLRIVSQCPQR